MISKSDYNYKSTNQTIFPLVLCDRLWYFQYHQMNNHNHHLFLVVVEEIRLSLFLKTKLCSSSDVDNLLLDCSTFSFSFSSFIRFKSMYSLLLAEYKNGKKISRILEATISVGLEYFIKNIKNTVRVQIQNNLINRVRVRKFVDPTGSSRG